MKIVNLGMRSMMLTLGISFFSLIAVAGETDVLANTAIDEGGKSFDESTHLINVGIGLGHNYYRSSSGFTNSFVGPNINVSYEQPWPKRIGPGYLGVGGYISHQRAEYETKLVNTAYYYDHKWNYMYVGGRAAYHWDVLNAGKAEVYAGTLIGITIRTYTYSTNDPNPNSGIYKSSDTNAALPLVSVFAGARWYFSKRVALFGEAAPGPSFVIGGLTFKF